MVKSIASRCQNKGLLPKRNKRKLNVCGKSDSA